MDNAAAASLVRFINQQSTRFSAWSLDFADRTWAILRDSRAARTGPCEEPILNVPDYIEHLSRRSPHSTELCALLEFWLSSSLLADDTAVHRQPPLSAVGSSSARN